MRLPGHTAKLMLEQKQTGQSAHADIVARRALISGFNARMLFCGLVLWRFLRHVLWRHLNVTLSQNIFQRSWSFPAIIVK
jgi:type VI protein secretion system component VasF